LITQEQLAPATTAEARRLTELLRPWEVHVVITARDLARQVPSGWQQGIKKRQTDRYEEYLDAVVHHLPAADQFWRHQDLAAVARAWSEAVGPHRVHVVIVPPPGGPQQLLLDRFCSVIGVDPGTLDTSGAVANTSLGHAQAELLRLVNQSLGTALSGPAKSAARAGQQSLAKRVLANQTGPPAKLPTRLHEWCREEARRSVRSLQEGGYDVVGDLEDLMPAFGDGPYPAEVSDAQVLASAVEALAAVVTSHQQALHKLEQQLGDSTGPAALPRSRRRSPADERRQPRATRSG
jgi:hypothetical protein